MLFVYDKEKPVLKHSLEYIKNNFPKNHELNLVLVNDIHNPLNSKGLDHRVIYSKTARCNNLRSFAWIKEQVDLFAEADGELIIKTDPDTMVRDWSWLLKPFEEGYEGMVGYGNLLSDGTHCVKSVLGACYGIHKNAVSILKKDIDTLWNVEWMDLLSFYLKYFEPDRAHYLPASEDIVLSMMCYHKGLLVSLPQKDIMEEYDWKESGLPSGKVVLLNNPGPCSGDSLNDKNMVADMFKKYIPKR